MCSKDCRTRWFKLFVWFKLLVRFNLFAYTPAVKNNRPLHEHLKRLTTEIWLYKQSAILTNLAIRNRVLFTPINKHNSFHISATAARQKTKTVVKT